MDAEKWLSHIHTQGNGFQCNLAYMWHATTRNLSGNLGSDNFWDSQKCLENYLQLKNKAEAYNTLITFLPWDPQNLPFVYVLLKEETCYLIKMWVKPKEIGKRIIETCWQLTTSDRNYVLFSQEGNQSEKICELTVRFTLNFHEESLNIHKTCLPKLLSTDTPNTQFLSLILQKIDTNTQ